MSEKEEIVFYWKATFTDGTKLIQFNLKNKETLFKEVLDKIDKLKTFTITNDKDSYIVDLVNKTIDTPHKDYKLLGKNPELIYFRRNSVRLEVGSGKMLSPRVVHHIGLKTSLEEKKMEVFAGLGMRPKEVKFNDIKIDKITDITDIKKVK